MYKGFKISWRMAIMSMAIILFLSILAAMPFLQKYYYLTDGIGTVIFLIPIIYGISYFKGEVQLKEIFPMEKFSPALIPVLILLATCMQTYVTFITLPLANLFELIFGPMPDDVDTAKSVMEFIFQVITIAVLPAVFEELMCRGVIMRLLKPYGVVPMLLFSSLIFAILHFDISGIVTYFMLGIILGAVRLMTNSLAACMLMHFCNNFFALLMINLQFGDTVAVIISLLCLLLFPFLIVIMIKKNYKKIAPLTALPKRKLEFSFEMLIALVIFLILGLIIAFAV